MQACRVEEICYFSSMKWVWLIIAAALMTSASAKSVALLIGNGDYKHCPELNNPMNDVKVMAGCWLPVGIRLVSSRMQAYKT